MRLHNSYYTFDQASLTKKKAAPTLENLPTEIQVLILRQLPDLDSVRCLVFSSSKYHQAYLLIRSEILFIHLLQEYNNQVNLGDSLAALHSKNLLAANPDNVDHVVSLLDFRRRATKEGLINKFIHHGVLDLDDTIALLKIHKAANYLLTDFSVHMKKPSWWKNDAGEWETELPLRFSPTERSRFFRAFYRLQIWCNIFGKPLYHQESNEGKVESNKWVDLGTFSCQDAFRLLFGTMSPWEIEEVGCLWTFMEHRYSQVFEEITNGLVETYNSNPSLRSVSPPAIGILPEGTKIFELHDLQEGKLPPTLNHNKISLFEEH